MSLITPEVLRLATSPHLPRPEVVALERIQSQDIYSAWYRGASQEIHSDPARAAYHNAVEALKKELTITEYQSIWLRSHNSMDDVQGAVMTALEEYKMKPKAARARQWLASCSARVMYYGTIFDMFSQHHPEYVSLAWGAMKFLFIAVLNHEELLTEVSKGIAKIADVLPRTELHSILYPTARMQEAVSLVYAKIIQFIIKAIEWYKQGKLMHSISAIIRPFSLGFKPILEDMIELSRRVDELANAASKAEIRDLHISNLKLNQRINQMTEMIIVLQQQHTLHNQSLLALRGDQKMLFDQRQIEEIRELMMVEDAPASEESYSYCRSLRDRRRQRMPTQIPSTALSKLKEWVSDGSSSLLLAQGDGVRTSCIDFAIDFVDAVLDRGYPILWTFTSGGDETIGRHSVKGILKSLIAQALNLISAGVGGGGSPINPKDLKATVTVGQWFTLFERCIVCFPRLFLVIDMAMVESAMEHEEADKTSFTVGNFVERMSHLVSHHRGELKVLIVSWRFSMATSLEVSEVFDEMHIKTDMGKRFERLIRQPKYRSIFRQRNRKLSERFKIAVTSEALPTNSSDAPE